MSGGVQPKKPNNSEKYRKSSNSLGVAPTGIRVESSGDQNLTMFILHFLVFSIFDTIEGGQRSHHLGRRGTTRTDFRVVPRRPVF